VDLPRLLKLMYYLIVPDGAFSPDKYIPNKAAHMAVVASSNVKSFSGATDVKDLAKNFARNLGVGQAACDQSRQKLIPNVQVDKFEKEQIIAQGEYTELYLGKYNGTTCVGKIMMAGSERYPSAAKSVLHEAEFLAKFHHPNCLKALGMKLTPEAGGMLVLTEFCPYGSIFDIYNSHGIVCVLFVLLKFCMVNFFVLFRCSVLFKPFGHFHNI
jgi:hypothetical protein